MGTRRQQAGCHRACVCKRIEMGTAAVMVSDEAVILPDNVIVDSPSLSLLHSKFQRAKEAWSRSIANTEILLG